MSVSSTVWLRILKVVLLTLHSWYMKSKKKQEVKMGKKVLFAEDDYDGTVSMIEIDEPSKEVDPNGVDQHAYGAKLDADKPDLSLLLMFGRALTEVGRVGTFGAEKYTRGGWRGVRNGINRYTAALLRHLFKEDKSPVDDDLPVLHAAQVAWNALARLELILEDIENSDEAERRGG